MKKALKIIITILVLTLAIAIYFLLDYFGLIKRKKYVSSDFDITVIKSEIDYNKNNVDDYTDILNGAKEYIKFKPKYKSEYYDGGYPENYEYGVCTDVIWYAFSKAGYSLKDMIDNDIKNHQEDYQIEIIDPNIDFRRVRNLQVFFEKYATSLTTDVNKIEEWMPGDIVIFGNNKHIGIVSNHRNRTGKSYIIHNGGQPVLEEDYLERAVVFKHYRFDATQIDTSILYTYK